MGFVNRSDTLVIIIQAILSQKIDEKMTVPVTKNLVFIRLLIIKDTSGKNLRTSPQRLDKSCQY